MPPREEIQVLPVIRASTNRRGPSRSFPQSTQQVSVVSLRWTFLSMIPRFAEIDKGPPLVRALGREGAAKLDEKFAGLIASSNYSIARFNTELSFGK